MYRRQGVGLLVCVCLWGGAYSQQTSKEKGSAWSKPVKGIRARLVSSRAKYKVGWPVSLTLEIQNVSEAPLSLDRPELMPVLSYPGSHPYPRHSYPWVITCQRPGQVTHILWSQRQVLKRIAEPILLKPGQTHKVEIIAGSFRKVREKDESKSPEPPTEVLHFVGAREPGVYLLKATFTCREGTKKARAAATWSGRHLETPVIRIELVK